MLRYTEFGNREISIHDLNTIARSMSCSYGEISVGLCSFPFYVKCPRVYSLSGSKGIMFMLSYQYSYRSDNFDLVVMDLREGERLGVVGCVSFTVRIGGGRKYLLMSDIISICTDIWTCGVPTNGSYLYDFVEENGIIDISDASSHIDGVILHLKHVCGVKTTEKPDWLTLFNPPKNKRCYNKLVREVRNLVVIKEELYKRTYDIDNVYLRNEAAFRVMFREYVRDVYVHREYEEYLLRAMENYQKARRVYDSDDTIFEQGSFL